MYCTYSSGNSLCDFVLTDVCNNSVMAAVVVVFNNEEGSIYSTVCRFLL